LTVFENKKQRFLELTMLTAEEIMTRDVIMVKEDTPIREAMEIMLKEQVSGVPVVSDDMSLAGVLSEKDVLNLLYDTEALKTKKVHYFMTEHAISFDIEDSLIDICDFLAKGLVRRVPITSNGKLVGIVSIPDIIKYTLSL
jgi:CBS domain-containing protein